MLSNRRHTAKDPIHIYIYIYIYIYICMLHAKLLQSCLTLCDPMDCNSPGYSVGFSRQEDGSGLPCPPPRDLPDPGIKPVSSALVGGFFITTTTWEAFIQTYIHTYIYIYTIPNFTRIVLNLEYVTPP